MNYGILHQLPGTSGHIKSKQQTFTLIICLNLWLAFRYLVTSILTATVVDRADNLTVTCNASHMYTNTFLSTNQTFHDCKFLNFLIISHHIFFINSIYFVKHPGIILLRFDLNCYLRIKIFWITSGVVFRRYLCCLYQVVSSEPSRSVKSLWCSWNWVQEKRVYFTFLLITASLYQCSKLLQDW